MFKIRWITAFILILFSPLSSAESQICYSDAECKLHQICNDDRKCVADERPDYLLNELILNNKGIYKNISLIDKNPKVKIESNITLEMFKKMNQDKSSYYCGLKFKGSSSTHATFEAQYYTTFWVNMVKGGVVVTRSLMTLKKGDLLHLEIGTQGFTCVN